MTHLERFYRIHGLLRSARQPVPMRRLIEELGVTRNTITRDFEYLRDFFGAPIVYDRDRNGHYYDPKPFAAAQAGREVQAMFIDSHKDVCFEAEGESGRQGRVILKA
ncbi:hypothetical protein MA04_01212 [Alcanivorax balearicus MACL04]|uniref:Helix-turn-helix type 11 domain-containing protein n=1 Tax=Alloalcanivorax balearicus MACL04 TaxID=1177182 RepID=A0ABT2QWL5_9GAMM|nr:HTH domain-containing protein [Alloalcanivorax balearicus]MCU5781912.1 hypothetical protein [Alloalcanivorax balearicus MACL04]